MQSFVHLHVHSAFSLRESILRVEDAIEDALAYDMPALALTDTNALYGAITFYQAAKKRGLQPILGAQFNVAASPMDEGHTTRVRKSKPAVDKIVALARNQNGYQALCTLVTLARSRLSLPYIDLSELKGLSTDLIVLIGGGESALIRQFSEGHQKSGQELMGKYLDAVPDGQLYVDVQDHAVPVERQGLPGLVQTASQCQLPLVATCDVHYRKRDDAALHRAYAGLEFAEADELWSTDLYHFATPEEMGRRFKKLPHALENTLAIADACRYALKLHQVQMPVYPTKDGRDSRAVLRDAATAGTRQRYGHLTQEIEARLNYELDVICDMGFADYFLVVADFIRFAHQQGISTGPGRGSAAGSLVAYALRITDVDPVANQLLFERFLNPERVSLPDIDTDFEYERRSEVIQYVVEKYGRDKVAQIGTFGTLAAKAAIRDAGRMLKMDAKLVDRLAKMIPGAPGMTLAAALEQARGLREFLAQDAHAERLYQTAAQLEGLPHHTSVHAAGVVISPTPLTAFVALDPGADGISVTQYAMADVESLGLVKMDFLGLRTLTLIDNTIAQVKERTEQVIDWRKVRVDDGETYAMLTKGETNGVFQLESPGMKRVLRRLKPTTLDDIVAVNALYRPGPMENIPTFIDAKHGKTPIRYPHPDLEPILADTYGVIVYQEQIMQIASRMAGFSLGDADILRRAVGKKKRDVLAKERDRFVAGCTAMGYDEVVANEVYDLIVRFADYGFNKSHAAAYAVLAFRTAYLRAHHLSEFLAASMTMSMASTDKVRAFAADAKQHNIQLLPVSVTRSMRGFTVEQDGNIRTGLLSVRNVGEGAVDSILSARSEAPFASLRDFLARVNSRLVNRKAIESLLSAGAFDEFFPARSTNEAKLQMLEEAQRQAEEDKQFAGLGLVLDESTQASNPTPAQGTQVLYIRYNSRPGDKQQKLKQIEQVLVSSKGPTPVALYDGTTRKTRLLGPKWRADVSPELVTMLEDVVGIGNVKLSYRRTSE